MGLEAGTIISDLNPVNPTTTDKRRQGDDHIRLIKQTLLNTFPNINAIINASDAEINYLVGVTSGLQAQLDAKLETGDLPSLSSYAQVAVENTWTKPQYIAPYDMGNVSGSVIIDCNLSSSFLLRLTANISLAFNNYNEGQEITLKLEQDSAGGRTVVWPVVTDFAAQTNPTLSTAANTYDVAAGKVIDGKIVFGFLRDLG